MSAFQNIVLPTRWIAEALQHRALILSNLLQAEPLSFESSLAMVHTAVKQTILQRQAWGNTGVVRYGDIIDQSNTAWVSSHAVVIIPELTGNDEEITVRDVFLCYLLGNLVTEIESALLNPHYPDRTFALLEAEEIPGGDMVLKNLGDYRIWRFEQLVQEGKIQY